MDQKKTCQAQRLVAGLSNVSFSFRGNNTFAKPARFLPIPPIQNGIGYGNCKPNHARDLRIKVEPDITAKVEDVL